MKSRPTALSLFHPLVARWFEEQVGRPTGVQAEAWPRIAAGEHLLITAPTGSGKTLAAFLWALDRLITGQWPAGRTRVLYVSPLRALNTDIRANLLGPLEALKEAFRRAGEPFPEIHVLTRSGDTPEAERRRMLHHPPEILITTPESLNLLLSSHGGRSLLTGLSTVILDEIHGVYGTKRGAYLMTAVDRLVPLSGEFQRIALSATLRPVEKVAEFVGGYRITGAPGKPRYAARVISIVQSDSRKTYALDVTFRHAEAGREEGASLWEPLTAELKAVIARNRSTLIFVNSRRLCEMLTLLINRGEEEPLAYAHHGSLSLEIRAEVERRLKAGSLRAIVATHSLELGIDIGALDEVILVQSPFSVSSAVQRVGRAGHQVGQTSRGTLLSTYPKDLLEAAVLVPAILGQEIEPARAVSNPLDVLAQVIVSMTGVETWDIDALYGRLKTSSPYRHLPRQQFDLVLAMLAGRYEESRLRELKPLVSIDRLDNTVSAVRGALQTLYLSGGVIPDRGYFHLRHEETGSRIGELDEEFVWEASPGDTFSLGAQNWTIRRITHSDVFVLPGNPQATATPFWKAEETGRDFHFSERIGRFLEEAETRLDDPEFAGSLERENRMGPEAAGALVGFLKAQKEATGCGLPHRHHLVMEHVSAGPGGSQGRQLILHTMWGSRVNRPFAMALDGAWKAWFGQRLELFVGNDCIVLQLPHEIRGDELLALVGSTELEPLLRLRLEGSGFFGARFRECAGRALLLPRGRFNERMPLWLSRLRSQKLLEAVSAYDDFPILLEAWRTCLQDEFDLESLRKVLSEIESGVTTWTEIHTSRPSPFAESEAWRQVNQYMYMDDTPPGDRASRLRQNLLREVVFSPGLRPGVSREVIATFEQKRQRLSPGYAPQTSRELVDWVAERVVLPKGEWDRLLGAMERDHGIGTDALAGLEERLVRFRPKGVAEALTASREIFPRVADAFYGEEKLRVDGSRADIPKARRPRGDEEEEGGKRGELLGQWLSFYGPVTVDFVRKTLGIRKERLLTVLEDLADGERIIQGQLVAGSPAEEICDAENFEALLRLSRREAVPSFEPLGIEWLPLFLAEHQGLTDPGGEIDGLSRSMGQLLCHPAEARAWESDILPARVRSYDPSWLDTLMQEGELLWVGGEGRKVAFCYESDLDLLSDGDGKGEGSSPGLPAGREDEAFRLGEEEAGTSPSLIPEPLGRYPFSALVQRFEASEEELSQRLWDEVWQGRVTNDTFLALRLALLNRFKAADVRPVDAKRLRYRPGRAGSEGGRRKVFSVPGNWRRVPVAEPPAGVLETEDLRKDRARLLLDRYGILFRELLEREWPALHWGAVFRALRIMELSGEVVAGIFFQGIPGPQFISPAAFRKLQRKPAEDAVYWVKATDPASVCGLSLEPLRGTVPSRLATTHLVYHGTRLVAVSKRNGAELTFAVPADDPDLQRYFIVLQHLLTRKFQPLRRIAVEAINDDKATESPYLAALRQSFDLSVDYREVTLFRKTR